MMSHVVNFHECAELIKIRAGFDVNIFDSYDVSQLQTINRAHAHQHSHVVVHKQMNDFCRPVLCFFFFAVDVVVVALVCETHSNFLIACLDGEKCLTKK